MNENECEQDFSLTRLQCTCQSKYETVPRQILFLLLRIRLMKIQDPPLNPTVVTRKTMTNETSSPLEVSLWQHSIGSMSQKLKQWCFIDTWVFKWNSTHIPYNKLLKKVPVPAPTISLEIIMAKNRDCGNMFVLFGINDTLAYDKLPRV